MDDALKAEERREETALRRVHLADSWVVWASTSASFFTRASVRWLRHLQSHLAPEDVRAHQDLLKILAAAEYTADATLVAAKFSAQAMASSITARCMLAVNGSWPRLHLKGVIWPVFRPLTGGDQG